MDSIEPSIITDDALDRSLRLLDNAWKSKDRSKFRVTPAKNAQRDFSSKDFQVDDLPQSTRIMRTESSFFGNIYDADLSTTITPAELKMLTESKSFNPVLQVNAAKTAQDRLFMDFMEAWQRSDSGDQVFGCILDFIQCCTDALELIQSSEDRSVMRFGTIDDKKYVEIESERNTWKLIYSLFQDRVLSMIPTEEMDIDMDLEKVSEKQLMERLYKKDSSIRELQLVIDWLEGNAAETLQELGLEGYTDKAVAWENTLHELQNKRAIPFKSTREFVSELDPDAPRRQRKHLHDLDQEDEDRLAQQILKEIRCGRLESAQTICMHAGQPWRAAIFEGWKLYHDPNYSRPANPVFREADPVEGNIFRDIWKLSAWRMCEDKTMPLKARAALAAYCGHLPTLLSASVSWEDYLWSYLKTIVDIRVEHEIRTYSYKTYVEMPSAYWNNEMSAEAVFKELAANNDPNVRREAKVPDHVVQKCLILGNIQQLMEEISKWIQGSDMSVGNDSESVSPHFLRFLTHLVLFLRHIGRNECDNIGDQVIEAYIKLLIEMKESELVAWYVSQLPAEDQIYYYSAFLEEITDSEEREAAIKAALQAGLNIDLITKTVVENMRQQPCNVENVGLEVQDVSPEDWAKISALDWLRFYPSQSCELVIQANALIAYFLATGNVMAARMAFNKVTEEAIAAISPDKALEEESCLNGDLDRVPKPATLALKEYLCYKTYLDADESFSDWFQHFHHGKPVEPQLPAGYTFMEKVAFQHKHGQYEKDLERWKLAMENQTKTTKALLFNVLTFPLGWLVDEAETDDLDRNVQMKALRSVIIPKVTFLLHLIMHSMGNYSDCVALADIIACHNYKLYQVFNKQRLQDLLLKIGESSVALMNEGKDPWGFPAV